MKSFGVGFLKTLSANVETEWTIGGATTVISATGRTFNANVETEWTIGDATPVIEMFLRALNANVEIGNDSLHQSRFV